ncbi:unnamed protein product, partial [Urochloa humidicola]
VSISRFTVTGARRSVAAWRGFLPRRRQEIHRRLLPAAATRWRGGASGCRRRAAASGRSGSGGTGEKGSVGASGSRRPAGNEERWRRRCSNNDEVIEICLERRCRPNYHLHHELTSIVAPRLRRRSFLCEIKIISLHGLPVCKCPFDGEMRSRNFSSLCWQIACELVLKLGALSTYQ